MSRIGGLAVAVAVAVAVAACCMVDAFFSAGGQELQLNCVDPATLRAAQADPAGYRDLVVRVAGFSEFFTKLDPAIQNEIIGRTEHVA